MIQPAALVKMIQRGLLKWYDFKAGGRVLCIGGGDALEELFLDCSVVRASCGQTREAAWQEKYAGSFDYILCVEALEQETDPQAVLRSWHRALRAEGTLLLGMNNRLGLRYFCGDKDPYTRRNFDGVEGYRRAYIRPEDQFHGRCYDQAELRKMLTSAGWDSFRFYSVLPDLRNPSLIFAEDELPNEDLATRAFPAYNDPSTVFLEEEGLYEGVLSNGMFHKMANAYLIECSPEGRFSDVRYVTSSMDRGPERACLTIARRSGIVEKRPACEAGLSRLETLVSHNLDLTAHGIRTIDGRVENGVYVMPYVDAEIGQVYLKRLLQTDLDAFMQEMDRFRDLILRSSEIVEPDIGDGMGAVLRRGYVDMVPLNSFHMGDTFVFFDQEFCEENYPANAILIRMIGSFYSGNLELAKRLPAQVLYDRYGLARELERWHRMEWEFSEKLLNRKTLRGYHETCRRNQETVHENRQRINYSAGDYQRLFVDIFRDLDRKKLVLFGSGLFAERFLALYGKKYPVSAIVDNNRAKWGLEMGGIPIQSPDLLAGPRSGEYKVLICIKNYLSVAHQLEELGGLDYGIFDAYKSYPQERRLPAAGRPETVCVLKKYRVGYIAGVFDLFHVGHLNMFRRAKEQCEYLIVGVVTDEGVRKFKKTEPVIPFEERVEMVRSCRYVDEAVEIPLNCAGTRDAFQMYQFDCQFSGSDYAEDPDWLAEKQFLEKHGAEMVFFPYTETTSSSKIKKLIEKRLL